MKILMLTPYLPFPPASGGQIRTLNLLRYLSRKHDITLICLYKDENEKHYASYLKSYCRAIYLCKRPEKPWQPKNILKSVFSLLPFLIVRNYSSQARQKVQELLSLESFDVIHAETFYIMPHIPPTDIPILLVEQTVEYQVYQHFVNSFPLLLRPFFIPDIIKLTYWERYYWKKAHVVAAVSEADQAEIKKLEPKIVSTIVPNGAGDEMYNRLLRVKTFSHPKFLFVGNFSWLQNSEAANVLMYDIFPKLKKVFPDSTLTIAGQRVNQKIKLPPNQSALHLVDLHQIDSEVVKKLYTESTLFLAPIYGPGGTRLKILAAMAAGLPVVSTSVGIQGLSLIEGKSVLVANTVDEFVQEVIRVSKDKKLYENLRINAHRVARDKYSWLSISRKLESIYKTITH